MEVNSSCGPLSKDKAVQCGLSGLSPQCTVVKKGNIIQILDYELGVFSETLELEKNWTKRIFGLSLHKKKF